MTAGNCTDTCGTRCASCDERMCNSYGPHPAPCGTHCEDHDRGCVECAVIRAELAMTADDDYRKGA